MATRYKPSTRRYRAAAFFDVDKTLVDGYLMDGWADYLADMKIVSRHVVDRIRKRYTQKADGISSSGLRVTRRQDTKKIEHLIEDFLQNIGNLMKGIGADQIQENAKGYIENLDYYMSKFVYAVPLVELVRDKGYTPIIISGGGPAEVIRAFAATLDIEERNVFSTGYEKRGGRMTGRIRTINAGKKARIVKAVAQQRRFRLEKSPAFGDSFLDLEMLRIVGYPVLIRPENDTLREIAENPARLDSVVRTEPWLVCDDVGKVVKKVDKYLPDV